MLANKARAILVFLICSLGCSELLANNDHFVGRKVITIRWEVEAKTGNHTIRKLALGKVYTVTRVQGSWLWFNHEVGGWVRNTDVVLYDKAINYFDRLVAKAPTSDHYYWRAIIWKSNGETANAIKDLEESIRLEEDVSTFMMLGNIRRTRKEYDKAIINYNAAIRLEPKYVLAHVFRGTALLDKGKLKEAIASYDKAVLLNPGFRLAYVSRGFALYESGDFTKAIDDYTTAIQLNPNLSMAYNMRGAVWYAMDKDEKAFADFTKAIKIDPASAHNYYMRGVLLIAKSVFENAITDFKTAVDLNPAHNECHNMLAWTLATCPDANFRDGNKAIEHAKKACSLTDWKASECIDTLAAAYASNGDFATASEWQRKAIQVASG